MTRDMSTSFLPNANGYCTRGGGGGECRHVIPQVEVSEPITTTTTTTTTTGGSARARKKDLHLYPKWALEFKCVEHVTRSKLDLMASFRAKIPILHKHPLVFTLGGALEGSSLKEKEDAKANRNRSRNKSKNSPRGKLSTTSSRRRVHVHKQKEKEKEKEKENRWARLLENSLKDGERTGLLQKVEIQNREGTRSFGCTLYPCLVWSLEASHVLRNPRWLGSVKYGVFLSDLHHHHLHHHGHHPKKKEENHDLGHHTKKDLSLKAELKTPFGLNLVGEVHSSGPRRYSFHAKVQTMPKYIHKGFASMSSSLGIIKRTLSGKSGNTSPSAETETEIETEAWRENNNKKKTRIGTFSSSSSSFDYCHELSFTFQEAEVTPRMEEHHSSTRSLPMRLAQTHTAAAAAAAVGTRTAKTTQDKSEHNRKMKMREKEKGKENGRRMISKEVAIVAGHWIDAGVDTGAPGEKETNLYIANRVTSKLASKGWLVWRPDNNKEEYTWQEYLEWVGEQTLRKIPVVEIHGQGRIGNIPAIGVIGERGSPLNVKLGKHFSFFPMDYKVRGVPRHGGTILEAYDTDKFRQMDPVQRYNAVESVSSLISDSIDQLHAEDMHKEKVLEGCSITGCPVDPSFVRKKGIQAKTYR